MCNKKLIEHHPEFVLQREERRKGREKEGEKVERKKEEGRRETKSRITVSKQLPSLISAMARRVRRHPSNLAWQFGRQLWFSMEAMGNSALP